MDKQLEKMNVEKRKKIINSAMKEFGASSYKKASTNIIIKDAGISKGLLYHYFKSKAKLFDYLILFTLTTMSDAIVDNLDWNDGDLITRMSEVVKIKLSIMEEYPYMFDFSKVMYADKTIDEVKAIVPKQIPNLLNRVYSHNIDYTLFKEHVDVEDIIKMIQIFVDGYSERLFNKIKTSTMTSLDLMNEMEELYMFLNMFKEAYYKG